MVAGAAASVGLALANDRRLKPAFVTAAAAATPDRLLSHSTAVGALTTAREFVARRFALAILIGVAVLFIAASLPAIGALASSLRSPASAAVRLGPPIELRAAAGVSGNWEQSYSQAGPSASQLGAALLAGAAEQRAWNVLSAMNSIAAQQQSASEAQQRAAAAPAGGGSGSAAAAPYSMGTDSGYAPGTVIRARVTIYGCSGPGGGFCNHMASGGSAFPGAAACSQDLAFGTRLTIAGDPTGRTYECLDRGSLAPTWIDVYFEDTSDGIAWQSQLGSTVANIQIVN